MARSKCITRGCRNLQSGVRPCGKSYGQRCHKCRQRAWRARNQERHAFRMLKDHAKEREIEFTITFAQFMQVAQPCGYIELRGNGADNLTIDRIDNTVGYVPGNLQPLTRAANITKRFKSDERRMRAGYAWKNNY